MQINLYWAFSSLKLKKNIPYRTDIIVGRWPKRCNWGQASLSKWLHAHWQLQPKPHALHSFPPHPCPSTGLALSKPHQGPAILTIAYNI